MTHRVRAHVLAMMPDGRVRLRLESLSGGCGRCDEPGGCRSARITHAFGPVNDVFELPDPQHVATHVGQTLWLELPEGAALRAALRAYAVPIIGILIGALAGHHLAGGHDLATLAGAGAGLLLAILLGRATRLDRPPSHIQLRPDTGRTESIPPVAHAPSSSTCRKTP
jgi:sigma-E factor negative regulatory protein RseC